MIFNVKNSLLLLAGFAIISNANAIQVADFSLTPYMGLDLGYKTQKFKQDYGHNVFKKSYPAANLFVGTKINEHFGLEFGIDRTTNKKNLATLEGGDILLGERIPNVLGPMIIKSKARTYGWHVGLTGYYPIMQQLSMIGSVGFKRASVKLSQDIHAIAGQPFREAPISNVDLSQTKTIARLSGGVQYFLDEHIGFRATITWENSSKLKPSGVSGYGGYSEARLKDSVGYFLGVVIK